MLPAPRSPLAQLPAPCSPLRRHFALGALAPFVVAAAVFAQGTLTPPGAPAPTMKSLSELDTSLTALTAKSESRIAIDTLPGDATALKIISAPGSYYLRGNLATANNNVCGIRVEADGVVIDLNGFQIKGSGASSATGGIQKGENPVSRLVVRNGTLTGWAFGMESATDVLASDLIVSDCSTWGVVLGANSIARHVTVRNSSSFGIVAGLAESCRVTNIGVSTTGAIGIMANIVRDSEVTTVTASGSAVAYGIQADSSFNCRVSHVTGAAHVWGIGALGTGFSMADHCVVEDVVTTGTSSNANGIAIGNVSHCNVNSVGGAAFTAFGINATHVNNCGVTTVSSSTATAAVTGIAGTHVLGCRVSSINGTAATTVGIFGQQIRDNVVQGISPTTGLGYGIRGNSGAQVLNNLVSTVRNYGIETNTFGVTIAENTVRDVGIDAGVTNGAGIYFAGNFGHIERNRIIGASTADYGIRVVNSFNYLASNRVTGNFSGPATGAAGVDTPEYSISGSNRFGAIVGTFAATGEITATNPYANFSD